MRRSWRGSTACPPWSAPATRPSGSAPASGYASTATAGSSRSSVSDSRPEEFTPPLTARLAEVSLADVASVGGKAASLGSLSQAGIAVPRGFVVLASAFRQAMSSLDPSGALVRSVSEVPAGDVPAIAHAAAGVRERIVSLALPPEVAAAIAAGYRSLGAPSGAH